MTNNFAKLLEILEIDVAKLIPINTPIRFRNVILPDESFFLDDTGSTLNDGYFFEANAVFTNEYVKTINLIRDFAMKNYKTLSQKKFYFIRGGNNQIGEERIAEYFNSKGYEVIRPENLPLEEQLNIFVNCESFASTLGSISHNVIFLKDESEVILIPRWIKKKLNTYQQALNQIHELNVLYIDATLSTYSPQHTGPFCYIISKQLRNFFGDEVNESYADADLENFVQYIKYALINKLPINDNAVRYYAKILHEFNEQLKQHDELLQKYGIKLN